MIGSDWLALFRKIPPELHDAVAIMLIDGTELIVQQVFRIDREFIVMKARLSGTTDGTRITVVPFSQIVFVSLMKPVPENDILNLFGKGIASPAPVVRHVVEQLETPLPEDDRPTTPVEFELPAAPPAVMATSEADSTVSNPRPGQVSKSILLARLRERLGQKK
ncbi:MAG: hypothetical protein K2X38_10550 [Gemmataceae bacterium]|nr:hypothetical protein [Gemmataceae bacterium]